MNDRTELRRLLDEAPPLPYRDSPRTHGDPAEGPTYVALEAQLEGRWEEVATGSYDQWSGYGIALSAAAVNDLPSLLDQLDAAEAALARVRELHRESHIKVIAPECADCECDHEDDCPPVDYAVCAECYDIGDQAHYAAYEEGGVERVAWPCPTRRAPPDAQYLAPQIMAEELDRLGYAQHEEDD